jgi:hypothetical protein
VNTYRFCILDVSTKMEDLGLHLTLVQVFTDGFEPLAMKASSLYTIRPNKTKLNNVRLHIPEAVMSMCYHFTPKIVRSTTKKLQKFSALIFAGYALFSLRQTNRKGAIQWSLTSLLTYKMVKTPLRLNGS